MIDILIDLTFFMVLKEVSYAHQGLIYLIKLFYILIHFKSSHMIPWQSF